MHSKGELQQKLDKTQSTESMDQATLVVTVLFNNTHPSPNADQKIDALLKQSEPGHFLFLSLLPTEGF